MLNLLPWHKRKELQSAKTDPARREDMDLERSAFFGGMPFPFGGMWYPEVDVSERDKEIIVEVEIPGMEVKDIDIRLAGRLLTVKGHKKEKKEQKNADYHILERRYGSFERTIELSSDVDPDNVKAEYKKGVLTIELRKTEESAKHRIRVKAG